MTVEGYNYYDEFDYTRDLHGKCKKYMYHHVILTMQDGNSFDGIIEGVDDNGVSVLVGEDVMEQERDDSEDQRYGYGYGYGRPRRRRFRRFRRRFFPFAALAALSLLPYAFQPYPYYPPYYPYY
ncbi:small nuclear ribonucleoprotein [Metabacillus bambusae]|uniref:small nuclear ribonucleoprotein n=1 Tax=Metabacillus bambusae TaxID=2795218 RepID=UPI001FB0E325|nr:small nuclear ribonucleoprotein [Metabacillus bambusae]